MLNLVFLFFFCFFCSRSFFYSFLSSRSFFYSFLSSRSSFFSLYFFYSGCSGSCFCCSSLFLTTTTACSFFLWFASSVAHFVVVYQFDECHFSIITKTVFQFDNTCVTSWTCSHFLRHFTEQDSYRFFVFQIRENSTT